MDTIVETLNDICRICLKQDDTVVHSMGDWVEIVEVISQIKISLSEEFPEKLCDECMQQLIAANEIRNLIIQSNLYFVKCEPEVMNNYVEIKVDRNENTNNNKNTQEEEEAENIGSDYTELEEVFEEEPSSIEVLEDIEIIGSLPCRCCICDEGYFDMHDFETHCLEVHNRELVAKHETNNHCQLCDRFFRSTDGYNRHRMCGDCGKHFVTSESLLVHKQKKTCQDQERTKTLNTTKSKISKQYGCCKCPELFASQDTCKSHFDQFHPDEIYTGNEIGVFSCQLCTTPFITKTELQKHLRAPRMKTYVCDQCNEQFPSFPKYKQHIESIHNNTQEFGCDECEKVYDRLESLRYHKYMHHNEKNNRLCPDCGKVFKKKVSFVEHRNIHLGLRPHVCSICKGTFTSTGALRTHMRSHTGAKPFKCKFCPKRYSHYSDMKRHSYSHTGEYPFVCETCNKGFAKRSALKTHQATHENR